MADLTDADLTGADLTDADLSCATTIGTRFDEAILDGAMLPEKRRPPCYY